MFNKDKMFIRSLRVHPPHVCPVLNSALDASSWDRRKENSVLRSRRTHPYIVRRNWGRVAHLANDNQSQPRRLILAAKASLDSLLIVVNLSYVLAQPSKLFELAITSVTLETTGIWSASCKLRLDSQFAGVLLSAGRFVSYNKLFQLVHFKFSCHKSTSQQSIFMP